MSTYTSFTTSLKEELEKVLSYNPITGVFLWKDYYGRTNLSAGCLDDRGYNKISFKGKNFYGHRLAWLLFYGKWPEFSIDHINRKRSDNRISNLREATAEENGRNSKKQHNNKSGYKGVYWDRSQNSPKKWKATIRPFKGKVLSLGCFLTPEEAHSAYCAAAIKYHGEFANFE